ncbi:hypothetical protein OSB04_018687 [Centaurea solstitialis]|uniref:Uncharacterized protein n=1 Tax=Centaurea solstitialis TaxID=347529 RepID=A0AA38WBS4_9ASTR|nr:hypothetical protein OSB04_018687 [Centaurea solstitialis]
MSSSTTQTTENRREIHRKTYRILNENFLHSLPISLLFLPVTVSAAIAIQFYSSSSPDFGTTAYFDPLNLRLIKSVIASSQTLISLKTLIIVLAFLIFVVLPTVARIALITYATNQAIYRKRLTFSSTVKSLSYSFVPLLSTVVVGSIKLILLSLLFTLSPIAIFEAVKALGFPFDLRLFLLFINTIVSYALAFTVVFFVVIWGSGPAIAVLELKSGLRPLRQSANQSTEFRSNSFYILFFLGFSIGPMLSTSASFLTIGTAPNWISILYVFIIGLYSSVWILYYVVANTVLYVQYKVASGGEMAKSAAEEEVSGEYVKLGVDDGEYNKVLHEQPKEEEEIFGAFVRFLCVLFVIWLIVFSWHLLEFGNWNVRLIIKGSEKYIRTPLIGATSRPKRSKTSESATPTTDASDAHGPFDVDVDEEDENEEEEERPRPIGRNAARASASASTGAASSEYVSGLFNQLTTLNTTSHEILAQKQRDLDLRERDLMFRQSEAEEKKQRRDYSFQSSSQFPPLLQPSIQTLNLISTMSSSTSQTTLSRRQLYSQTLRILNANVLHFIPISLLFLPLTFSAAIAVQFYKSSASSSDVTATAYFDPPNLRLIKSVIASSQTLVSLKTLIIVLAFAFFAVLPTVTGIALITYATNQAIHRKRLTFSSAVKSLSGSYIPLLSTVIAGSIKLILISLLFTLSPIVIVEAVNALGFPFDLSVFSVFVNSVVFFLLTFTVLFFVVIWGSGPAIAVLELKSGLRPLRESANQSNEFRSHSFSVVFVSGFVIGSMLSNAASFPIIGNAPNWISILYVSIISLYSSVWFLDYVVANTVLYVQYKEVACGGEMAESAVKVEVSGEYVKVGVDDVEDKVLHEHPKEEIFGAFFFGPQERNFIRNSPRG